MKINEDSCIIIDLDIIHDDIFYDFIKHMPNKTLVDWNIILISNHVTLN